MSHIVTSLNLADLDGSNGFRLDGAAAGDESGFSVSRAGDVNGDGYDDLIIGAWMADPNGLESGSTYVVFGKANGYAAVINLSSLDGSNGFRLDGEGQFDISGNSVSSAGDINADGFDDLIIGSSSADPNASNSGTAFVVFGKASGFTATINLATLQGDSGFRLNGTIAQEDVGWSVSGGGDINGDGFGDVIVGAINGGSVEGEYFGGGVAYVFYGRDGGFSDAFDLDGLNGVNGFSIVRELGQQLGWNVNLVGDINGDGFDDVIVGEPFAYHDDFTLDAGYSYVVFGREGSFGATFSVDDLNGDNGFRLVGGDDGEQFGRFSARAGDINGDGYDDLIVSAWRTPHNGEDSGSSYVLFGKAGGFSHTIDVDSLNGTNGFRIDGVLAGDRVGWGVGGAGDFNGDGFDDLIIGARRVDANGIDSGASYLVFGRAGGYGAVFDLTTLDGRNGFRLEGVAAGDDLGYSVSGAGDINGDGFDDLILGAGLADPNGVDSGSSYVVFGRANPDFNHAPAGNVLISGQAIKGETLIASNTLTDEDELGVIAYQWRADGVAIDGATSDSYTLTQASIGKTITVSASYTDGQGTTERVDSSATAIVVTNDRVIEGGAGNDLLIGGNGDDTIRGFAGRDTLEGREGNDRLEGGDGLDLALYNNNLADYSLANVAGEITVTGPQNDGTDTLIDVERLQFTDLALAFDLDGNAGTIAKLLGVVLGKDNWYHREFMGIGIDIVDHNDIPLDTLMGMAFEAVLGPNPSNRAVVNLIYTNLVGQAPAQTELTDLTANLLDNGAFTQGSLGVLALDYFLNLDNIDFVGLSQTGVEYFSLG